MPQDARRARIASGIGTVIGIAGATGEIGADATGVRARKKPQRPRPPRWMVVSPRRVAIPPPLPRVRRTGSTAPAIGGAVGVRVATKEAPVRVRRPNPPTAKPEAGCNARP